MSLFFLMAFQCHLLEKHLDRFSQNKRLASMSRHPLYFQKYWQNLSGEWFPFLSQSQQWKAPKQCVKCIQS